MCNIFFIKTSIFQKIKAHTSRMTDWQEIIYLTILILRRIRQIYMLKAI